jgi:hypothetical protein
MNYIELIFSNNIFYKVNLFGDVYLENAATEI